ncbi:citramalyl-CoA lyase, mitochondrial-like isoform X2 [Periplaneta americana]|uniref:citramalyl-CoA lyase, mitochondrial-like isoform X2 n=1 Tax=Periplaneta americana TaxID=6978 RepID=UPI0037E84207
MFGFIMLSRCSSYFLKTKLFSARHLIKPLSVRSYTARRAILYVPGDQEKKLTKAINFDVDCIALDCEDGVAVNKKDVARENIHKMLHAGPVSIWQPEWSVRVNAVNSGLCEEDLEAVLSARNLPPTLLLPKVEHSGDLDWFSDKIKELLSTRDIKAKMNLIIYIESAKAVMDLPELCTTAKDLSMRSPFEPVALVLGSDDLCASLGAVRSTDGIELLYSRQRLVLVAKAFEMQAIDMVHIKFQDLQGLREQCEMGKRMGFTGKQVIHPCQVPIVQETFLPNKDAINWAEGLVTAFYEHQKRGQGVFVYNGSMIDKPSLRQAQNILHLAKLSTTREPAQDKQ